MWKSSCIVVPFWLVLGAACAATDSDDAYTGELGAHESALIVPASDGTAPATLVLGMAESGANSATSVVSLGSSAAQALSPSSKAAKISYITAAVDAESGIRELALFCLKRTTTCNLAAGVCQNVGPGLVGAATNSIVVPQASPGQSVADFTLIVDQLDLAAWIPQSPPASGTSRTISVQCFVTATNHFGGQTATPSIDIVWSEQGAAPAQPAASCLDQCVESCRPSCPSGREFRMCLNECRIDCRDVCSQQ